MLFPEQANGIKNENLQEAYLLIEEFYNHMPYMDETTGGEVKDLQQKVDQILKVLTDVNNELKDFNPARMREEIKMWEKENDEMWRQLREDQRGVDE